MTMKTTTSPQSPETRAPELIPQRPKVYWVLKRWGGTSEAEAARFGLTAYKNPFEHEGLTKVSYSRPQDLMKYLRGVGWKTAAFTNSREKFARVEVTRAGFNVVYFESYAAAVEAHKGVPSEAGLAACPFCHLADQLEIIGWPEEGAGGTDHMGEGEGVRCNRCECMAPLSAWTHLSSVGAQTKSPA